MSGFAAVFRFDGAPADPAMASAMADAIGYRGPDGRAAWSGGPAAMVHLMLRTTAESLEEAQPLASEDGSLVLVMDGWLANYDELRTDLLARGAVLRSRSDAELVLRAYETWGDDCPKHIDGEYAFVVWDARSREAFCVKDHAGRRPLHYHWDGKRLLVASDLAGVIAAGDFEPRGNRGMIAEHIANLWCSRDESLWDDVMRLLPAHTLRVGSTESRLRGYWEPPAEVTIRHRRDADYQEQYLAILDEAIRRASRSHLPLACEVSGGLDSSAIFALAHAQAADARLQAPRLEAYSYNFGAEGREDIDEIAYALAAARFLGATLHEVAPFMPGIEWFRERGSADRDLSTYPNMAMANAIGHALTGAGCRVDLNGEGGNEFLEGSPYYFGDQLAESDWRGFVRSWREDVRAGGVATTLRNVWRYGVKPNTPAALRAGSRRLRNRALRDPYGLDFRWLSRAMRQSLRDRWNAIDRFDAIRSPSRRRMMASFRDGFVTYGTDMMNRQAARNGYELRSPMYAREFIEFAFATPERLRLRAGVYKPLHIDALEGRLPPSVLHRKMAVNFSLPFERLLDTSNQFMVADLLQCGIDWFDPDGLQDLYRCYRHKPPGFSPIYEVWAVVGCVNLFCRVLEGGPGPRRELSNVDFERGA